MVAAMISFMKKDRNKLTSGKRIVREYAAPNAEAAISLNRFTGSDKNLETASSKK
jgi:hypothetical protein